MSAGPEEGCVNGEPLSGPGARLQDRWWAFRIALAAVAVTMLPYLFGASLIGAAPSRGWFSWLGYNLDDSCVYLAWMRQAADGAFFQRNLFTTEPQIGHQFSIFFLALGSIARWTHLPLLFVYHAARIVLGLAFLHVVWWLLELLVANRSARRCAFLMVCFSAGVGWLPGLWRASGINSPVDVWQPEAITFLCLYQSPLFLVSLLLMLGVLGGLWVARERRSWRAALLAGGAGLLLGNIHTYDVITLAAVWGAFLVVQAVRRRLDAVTLAQAICVGCITAISTGYMVYLVKTEDVFARRVAVPTLSPPFTLYALGYGLLLVLAAFAVCTRQGRAAFTGNAGRTGGDALAFLATWAVVNVAVAYLPVTFQRKMLMGAHLPIAILAGASLSLLVTKVPRRWGAAAIWAAVGLLGLTNVRFMLRDADNFQANRGQSHIQRPYLYSGEVAALHWLREHAPSGAPLQPLPWLAMSPEGRVGFVDTSVACFAPGLTGHPVHAGHWGETPEFAQTMGVWVRFLLPTRTAEERAETLARAGVRYIVFTQKHDEDLLPQAREALTEWLERRPRGPLRLVAAASNADADVYEVAPAALRAP